MQKSNKKLQPKKRSSKKEQRSQLIASYPKVQELKNISSEIQNILKKDMLEAGDAELLSSVASTKAIQMKFIMINFLKNSAGRTDDIENGRMKMFESVLERMSSMTNEESLYALSLMNQMTAIEFEHMQQIIEMSGKKKDIENGMEDFMSHVRKQDQEMLVGNNMRVKNNENIEDITKPLRTMDVLYELLKENAS